MSSSWTDFLNGENPAAADSGSDVLQQFCGSHRITRGVTVGEIGHGDDVCEVSIDCAVEIITTYHCYDRNGSRA